MPSRSSRVAAWLGYAWLLAAAIPSAPAQEASTLPVAQAARPSSPQITRALEQLRQDPNLGTERKARTLKWKSSDSKPKALEVPGWLQWLQGLFTWIAGSARLVVWVLAGVLAAFVAIYIIRLVRARTPSATRDDFKAPSHVQDMDIRPESLPDDIGATALALWESGEQRRALALLYRGLLSRLVHVHRVPVRDSTTEGECMVLARRHLPAASASFTTGLVSIWQLAVYGEQTPATEQVRALCAGFSAALNSASTETAST